MPGRDNDFEYRRAVPGRDPGKAAVGDTRDAGIGRIDFDERFRGMGGKPRTFPRAGHGVPLIAHASGIQVQRIDGVGRTAQFGRLRSDESCVAIVSEKAARGKESFFASCLSGLCLTGLCGPHYCVEVLIVVIRQCRERANVEIPLAVVLERRQRGMFAKDVGWSAVVES